jgi:hypothetical protein
MHVHVPKPLHGWRAFFNEIFVIIIGVLIALGLEQTVEAYHWHEKGELAQEAMRIEMLDDNAPQLYIRLLIYPCLEQTEAGLLEHADTLPASRLRDLAMQTGAPWNTFDSEAWKAVQSSDLANHVDPEKLIQWSLPYRLMPSLSTMTAQEHMLQAELHTILRPSGIPSQEERAQLRRVAGQLRTHNSTIAGLSLVAMQRLGQQKISLPEKTMLALERETRSQYGACVRHPNLSSDVYIPKVHNDAVISEIVDSIFR